MEIIKQKKVKFFSSPLDLYVQQLCHGDRPALLVVVLCSVLIYLIAEPPDHAGND